MCMMEATCYDMHMTKIAVQVSSRSLALLAMDSITSRMPIRFANGAHWSGFNGRCSRCQNYINPELLCGSVTMPLPSVAVIEAAGICHECKLVTTFLYRLHDDRRITGLMGNKWCVWRPKMTLIERLLFFMKRLAGYLK